MWLLILASAALCGVQSFTETVDVFFIRHVESQWNCYNDHSEKDNAKAAANGCPPSTDFRDAAISRDGALQLKEIFDTLGNEIVSHANPLKTALSRDTVKGDSNKVAFMTSNLRRAAATAIVARESLINAFNAQPESDPLNQINADLADADFIVTSTLQEQGNTDTESQFPTSLKSGPFDQTVWSNYLIADWPTPPASRPVQKAAADKMKTIITATSAVEHGVYVGSPPDAKMAWPSIKPKLAAFKNVLHDQAELGKEVFIVGGHSVWFMKWMREYGANAATDGNDFQHNKVKNGEMVHAKVNLSESVIKNNLDVLSVDSIFIPPSLRPKVREGNPDQAAGNSAATTQYANTLMAVAGLLCVLVLLNVWLLCAKFKWSDRFKKHKYAHAAMVAPSEDES